MSHRILIIDDEPAIARTLLPVLASQSYQADSACTAKEGLDKASRTETNVVLLDLGLPDADGKDIIASLRKLNVMSIIILSARHQETEKVAALDQGADDYVNKPFSIDELLARIRVAVRRLESRQEAGSEFRSLELCIDYAGRKVRLLGEEVKLSPKEFDLLEVLARHVGQVVTHRRLMLAGWNDPTVDGQYLRSYIGMLRQKLEADPSEPELILTETGVGYRLLVNIETI
jgi:two-component system KDP operon response regulator KdpE